jgi:hypothetical protein
MKQKTYENKAKLTICLLTLLFLVCHISLIHAATTQDFDEILKPIQTIYDFAKYAVTIIAGLVLLFAGITYITSGSDTGKREKAKNMVMYVIIGLVVIWAAPVIVRIILEG